MIIPDILANSGGVVVSYYEWLQNLHNEYWSEKDVLIKLENRMCSHFIVCSGTSNTHVKAISDTIKKNISKDLRQEFPEMKGLSAQNLKYMSHQN